MRAALVAALAAAALVAGASTAAAPSGLYGKVTRGPTTPVCRVGVPCTEPARNTILIFSGKKSVRVKTDGKGNYRVALPPGRYIVHKPDLDPGLGGISPGRVIVPSGRFKRQNFSIDTGIR